MLLLKNNALGFLLFKMIKKFELWLIKQYQKISKTKPNKCRMIPTCSNYAKTAIIRFGFFKGNALFLKRLTKCASHHSNFLDNVPQNLKGDFKWLM